MIYPKSDHYDGQKFYNQNRESRAEKDFFDLLKWMRNRNKRSWPKFHLGRKQAQLATDLKANQAVVTFINHATLLIQIDGANILTDPVFAERVSPLAQAGPKRVREPGLKISELPKIDFILLSHNHYDHLDLKALKEIFQKWNPQLICPLGHKAFFRKNKILKVEELDWWHGLPFGDHLRFSLTPAQHWSSRSPFDRNLSLWGGFVIESNELKIFFAGDTGYYDHFKQIHQKFGRMDISLLPIGSYDPVWFMKDQHVNPRESVMAHLDLDSQLSIGIHFGCFQLTDEGIHEPAHDLAVALKELNVSSERFVVPDHGESFHYQKK